MAGLDEAGRGPLAGPVVAAVVVLRQPDPQLIPGLGDSKQLSPARREAAFDLLHQERGRYVVGWGIGWASPAEIDQTDILRATHLAAARALKQLPVWPELLLTDALMLPGCSWKGRQIPLVRGDGRCLCIGAASILAKVTRDRIMAGYDTEFPGYGFARHQGYPTPEHYQALADLGATAIHRRSFLRSARLPDTSGV